MHCSLKLKKKVIFYSALQFASLFLFILSFTLSSVTLSPFTEAQFSPFTEAQVSSSLWSPLTWLSSTSPPPIVNVTTIHRPPPKPPLSSNPIVATRSLPPIVNVNICFNMVPSRWSAQTNRRSTLSASDPPPSASDPRRRSECLLADVVFVCDFWFLILFVISDFDWSELRKRLEIWVFFFFSFCCGLVGGGGGGGGWKLWLWLWMWLWLWLVLWIFFGSEIYYFIVIVILFYYGIYIILLC